MPITRQKSPIFSIVSLPTDSVIVDHAVFSTPMFKTAFIAYVSMTKLVVTYQLTFIRFEFYV
jgi:hypothetical protein